MGANLKLSIQIYFKRTRRLFLFSIVTSLLYSMALVIFFASVIAKKTMILGGIIIILILMTILSIKIWNGRIKKLTEQVNDFTLN